MPDISKRKWFAGAAPIALGVLGMAGCIASSFPQTPAHGGPVWQEITTEHFVVDTDLESTEAVAAVRQLENLRKVMAETVFGGEPPPGPRARVLALRQAEYGHFDRISSGLFLSSVLFQPMLVTSPGGEWDTFDADVRKHELGHYVSSLYVDIRLQPKWFAEGLAGFLETARYDEKSGAVEIGRRPANYEYLEHTKQATPDELWSWGDERPYDQLTARLYQTSWAVVHYLFDQRPAELLDYQRALARGEDDRKAWNQIFPDLVDDGLADAVKKYIHKRNYKVTKTTVPPVAVAVKTRPLTESDVLAFRSALYMALRLQSKRTAEESKTLALTNVTASLELGETNFWAHQVNWFYFDTVPSGALARESISTEQDNWLAWLWYAEVLRRGNGALAERRSALQKSLALAPGHPLALTQFAWVEAQAGNWSSALDASTRAVGRPPASPDAMVVFAASLSHSGRCDDARTIESRITQHYKGKIPAAVTTVFNENRRACQPGPAP